ncbi:MAG: serine hydrolase, partial [Longimicrobiales bacterium]|nr:serine hydrolase [Longimicrobiales bacterium]
MTPLFTLALLVQVGTVPSAWEEAPPLPRPVSNNAVAAVEVDGVVSLFSFLGLDERKGRDSEVRWTFRLDLGDSAWTEGPPVPGPGRLAASAQGLGGRVYLFGGYTVEADGSEWSVPDVDIFDPATGAWSSGAPIPVPVDDAVSGVWRDSLIYLVSGWHDTGNELLVQLYDPGADRWLQATPIAGPAVFGHTGALTRDALVYLDGVRVRPRSETPPGQSRYELQPSSWLGAIDPDDPLRIKWSALPPHPGPPLYRAASVAVGSRVFFFGGTDNAYNYDGLGYDGRPATPADGAFAWDLEAERWTEAPAPAVPTMDHRGALRAGGYIWIIGGMESGQRVTDRVQRVAIRDLAVVRDLAVAPVQPADAQEPPRTPEERRAAMAWGAHHLCAGVFVVGRDLERSPDVVLERDVKPFAHFRWEDAFDYAVDWARERVTVSAPGLEPRHATYHGDQGCVIEADDGPPLAFPPTAVESSLPDPRTQRWPTGDLGAHGPLPEGADAAALDRVLDRAMGPANQNTRALVVLHRGRIVGERYAEGFGPHTPQLSWSQGKSLAAAFVGVLAHEGALSLDQLAPIDEWHADPNDPRRRIRIRHLLNMSSGLDFLNLGVNGPRAFTAENEHFRIYQDAVDVCRHSIDQPVDAPPDSLFRYRNSDPLTLTCIVRRIVEARGEAWASFPQRALFDRIGIRDAVLETDRFGNFIITGYDFMSAWDWARFGLLHLQDGVWGGERILPEGWVDFVSAPAPADPGRNYGGLFWVNAGGRFPNLPGDAYTAAGFMGQNTVVIPSLEMVVVRLGPSPGGSDRYLNGVIAGVV